MPLPIATTVEFDSYQQTVVDSGNQPALFLLLAFGITFLVTRFITHSIRVQRFSWLKDVETGGTHIHHLVWGICLLLISGFVAIVVQPRPEVSAVIFGIGAALTLDEFALWLHLDDVYWSEQGRQSIDAVIIFAIVTGFMVIGVFPVTIGTEGGLEDAIGLIVPQVIGWIWVVICFLKGKLLWGVFGIYIPFVSIFGAIRIAKPDSWWARKRYDEAKMERSRKRYAPEEKVHKPVAAGAKASLVPGSD